MSDWRTLHFFDSDYMLNKVIPGIKTNEKYLTDYFNSALGKQLFWNDIKENRITEVQRLTLDLTEDFTRHKNLYDLESTVRRDTESYDDYIHRRSVDIKEFLHNNVSIIEDFNRIFTLIIFSECAAFNPHLVLGRRIFSGCIETKEKSLAESCCDKLITPDTGSIFITNDAIYNWLTQDEVHLLYYDFDKVSPADDDALDYYLDFKKIVEIAHQKNLGLMACSNAREGVLYQVRSRLDLRIDIDDFIGGSVIMYKG